MRRPIRVTVGSMTLVLMAALPVRAQPTAFSAPFPEPTTRTVQGTDGTQYTSASSSVDAGVDGVVHLGAAADSDLPSLGGAFAHAEAVYSLPAFPTQGLFRGVAIFKVRGSSRSEQFLGGPFLSGTSADVSVSVACGSVFCDSNLSNRFTVTFTSASAPSQVNSEEVGWHTVQVAFQRQAGFDCSPIEEVSMSVRMEVDVRTSITGEAEAEGDVIFNSLSIEDLGPCPEE